MIVSKYQDMVTVFRETLLHIMHGNFNTLFLKPFLKILDLKNTDDIKIERKV